MAPRPANALPVLAALAMAAAPAAAPGAAPPPVPWLEPGPTARLFLQQPLEAPEPVAAGRLGLDLRVHYANALVQDRGYHSAIDADLESALLTVALRAGLGGRVEASLALQAVEDTGGFLDGVIDWVEGAMDARSLERAARPRGRTAWVLSGPSGTMAGRGGGARLGDSVAGAKVLATSGGGAWPAMALRAALKIPTGSPTAGSGRWDAGGGALAAWTWPSAALRLSLDLTVPGGGPVGTGLAVGPALAAQAGLSLRLAGAVWLQAQVSAHQSPLRRTSLTQLDSPISDALLGVAWPLRAGVGVQVALAENIASPRRGADAALVLVLSAR